MYKIIYMYIYINRQIDISYIYIYYIHKHQSNCDPRSTASRLKLLAGPEAAQCEAKICLGAVLFGPSTGWSYVYLYIIYMYNYIFIQRMHRESEIDIYIYIYICIHTYIYTYIYILYTCNGKPNGTRSFYNTLMYRFLMDPG